MNEFTRLLLENLIELGIAAVAAVLSLLLGRMSAALERAKGMEALKAARGELEELTRSGVDALQQTTVEGLKACTADGKLTAKEIADLEESLLCCVRENLSQPAEKLLTAARVDVEALIKTTAEAYLCQKKELQHGTDA